jgi:hypothetical protein
MNPEVMHQLGPLALKAAMGLVITGLLGVIMWPFRKAHKEWIALKGDIAATHKELVQQRTNCLNTLQNQGDKQIELLGKTVAALDGVRLELATQTGYLQAAALPVRRVRHK